MPNCSVTTRVAGPTNGTIATLALSVSLALTAKTTTSTKPISTGVSVALTWRRMISPSGLSTRKPVPLHGFKVGTARDEDDVFAGLGEPRAQIATDTA